MVRSYDRTLHVSPQNRTHIQNPMHQLFTNDKLLITKLSEEDERQAAKCFVLLLYCKSRGNFETGQSELIHVN